MMRSAQHARDNGHSWAEWEDYVKNSYYGKAIEHELDHIGYMIWVGGMFK